MVIKQYSVEEWIHKSSLFQVPDPTLLNEPFTELDAFLTLRSFLVGYSFTDADSNVWKAIKGNPRAAGYLKQGTFINVSRWYKYIGDTRPELTATVQAIRTKAAAAGPTKEEQMYDIALADTENGVVTRFPPEPSGYLHIGHAKAALLNDYFGHEKYKGKLILRFDDTNPSKEKEEFQDTIAEDLSLMGITPDIRSHTSDYFQELHDWCIQAIKEGNAYADDTEKEIMQKQRFDGIPSARRDIPAEESLAKFELMKTGSEEGLKWCIRAKISPDNLNKALRDPVIYRCNLTPHHRTGTKWKVYPTYDFCCPLIDSHEGVTHALRTTEYRDRDAQYQWFIKALKVRGVHNWDFQRLNFIRTLLSKRKLTKFVEDKLVWGWDDPRMPTVRGIRRRGMTVAALREFMIKQGPSRNITTLDWTQFWAINKKHIDPVASRYTAIDVDKHIVGTVDGPLDPKFEMKDKHAKFKLGQKKVWYSNKVLIEQADAASFEKGEEVTLMNWGNAFVEDIVKSTDGFVTGLSFKLHLEGDFKKTKKKITWLSPDQKLVKVDIVDFDYLITKDSLTAEELDNYELYLNPKTEFRTEAIADENVSELKADDIIQIDRKGYFRVDSTDNGKVVLFNIPTGKTGSRD